jgi:hypothetical protein
MHVAKQTNGLRAVFLCLHDFQILQKSLVGVSLLAMASCHSTSPVSDMTPSRAGSLLQGFAFFQKDFERAVTQRHLVSLEGQASANALVKTLTKTGETS